MCVVITTPKICMHVYNQCAVLHFFVVYKNIIARRVRGRSLVSTADSEIQNANINLCIYIQDDNLIRTQHTCKPMLYVLPLSTLDQELVQDFPQCLEVLLGGGEIRHILVF